MQAAHNPPPNVGYPHAGQIVMRFPSGGVLMATAVSFAVSERVPLHSPAHASGRKDPGKRRCTGPPLNTNCSTLDGPGPPPAWRKRLIVAAKKRLVRLLLARLLAALAARSLLLRLVSAAAAAVTTLGAARTLAEPARGSG